MPKLLFIRAEDRASLIEIEAAANTPVSPTIPGEYYVVGTAEGATTLTVTADPPVYTAQPTVSPASVTEGDTITIVRGAATGLGTLTQSIYRVEVDGVSVADDLVATGAGWTYGTTGPGTFLYREQVADAWGNTTFSDSITVEIAEIVDAALTLTYDEPTDTVTAATNAAGTYWWAVTTSATPPSKSAIKAGTGAVHSGSIETLPGSIAFDLPEFTGAADLHLHAYVEAAGGDTPIASVFVYPLVMTTLRLLDTFTGDAEITLVDHEPDLGGVWTWLTGTHPKLTGAGRLYQTGTAGRHYNTALLTADQRVEADVVHVTSSSADSLAIFSRLTPFAWSGNYDAYGFRFSRNAGNIIIGKWVNAVETALTTIPLTPTLGQVYTWALECVDVPADPENSLAAGVLITAYLDGVQIAQHRDTTSPLTGALVGIRQYRASSATVGIQLDEIRAENVI